MAKFLKNGGHIVIITQINPYTPVGGVTVVLKNLLSGYDKSSYTFAFLGRLTRRTNRLSDSKQDVYRLIPNYHIIHVFGLFIRNMKINYAVKRAVKLIKKRKATAIIGLYPTLASIEVSLKVSKLTNLPFYPYLHDTLSEGLSATSFAKHAKEIQSLVFENAEKIITMSEGMSDLYKRKYDLKTFPLEHSYPEKILDVPNFDRNKNGFWGGEVYAINNVSFSRVQKAMLNLNTKFTVTSLSPLNIEKTSNIHQTFYPTRKEYIDAVNVYGIMVLSINWPDESKVHEDELSTIFPTKSVEYLATGAPILVHCPKHYFLAKFFYKHKCGLVVDSNNIVDLENGILKLQSKDKDVQQMQKNALKVMEVFSLSRIQSRLEQLID